MEAKSMRGLTYQRITRGIFEILTLFYAIACTFLYYMQSIQSLDYNNRFYQSDLPFHISMIVDDGWYYSFTAYAYEFLYKLGAGGTYLIAIFLGLLTYGTVIFTEKVLRKLSGYKKCSAFTLGSALILQLLMPFYLPFAGQYRYVSYQSGNLWHNSTYQCMRFFAVIAMYMFLDLSESYKEKLPVKKLLLFTGNLVLCTGIKPSFLTVFAPIMALKLCWDLLHRVSFKNIFLFGCTVLPACGVMLWQNMVLFGDDTGNGFTISPWTTFSFHADRPKLAVFCSVAFPGMVLLTVMVLFFLQKLYHKNEKGILSVIFSVKTRNTYVFYWLVNTLGFLLALCLQETGTRSRDGNFLWGYFIGIFMIQIVSYFIYFLEIRNRKSKLLEKGPERMVYMSLLGLQGLILIYQLYCGIYFWINLLMGETYYMVG